MEQSELHRQRIIDQFLQSASQDTPSDYEVIHAYNVGGKFPPIDPPKRSGGDGDDGMADLLGRVSRLEQWFAGVVIGGLILFAGVAWTLHSSVAGRVDSLGDRIAKVEGGLERVDERTAAMQRQQDKMDGKLDELVSRK